MMVITNTGCHQLVNPTMKPCQTYARVAVDICSIHCVRFLPPPPPPPETSLKASEDAPRSAPGRSTSPSHPIRRSSRKVAGGALAFDGLEALGRRDDELISSGVSIRES